MSLLTVGSLCCFIRLTSWSRLFSETRYLIRLIMQSIIDMRAFTIVLSILIVQFAIVRHILPAQPNEKGEIEELTLVK